jgi:tyramine---L-glutamate ligase
LKILAIEHFTAFDPESPLAGEGLAMLSSVVQDLADLPDVRVAAAVKRAESLTDLPVEPFLIEEMAPDERASAASSFDGVLVIAPEMNRVATDLAISLEVAGATLLSPPARFVEWASDKLAVARSLPTISPPTNGDYADGGDFVVKPRDGVGCLATAFVDESRLNDAVDAIRRSGYDGELIVQPRVTGRAMSVAVVGRKGKRPIILPAAEQKFDETMDAKVPTLRSLTYQGGRLPIVGVQDRVASLIHSLWNAVAPFDGWFGVDFILADDGRDVIVDVNPRLTTSYLGYSRLLAGAAAQLIIGRETADDLALIAGPFDVQVEFGPTGRCDVHSQRM